MAVANTETMKSRHGRIMRGIVTAQSVLRRVFVSDSGMSARPVSRDGFAALRGQNAIAFRAPVAEKLPHFANLQNHVEVEVGHQHFVFVAAGLGKNFASRIAEVTLAVKFPDAPRLLFAYPVDGADKIAVGDGMRGCSSSHKYSERPATVAEGLKIISAPFNPRARAPSGKCRS